MFTITSLQLLKMFLLVITGFIAFRSGLITHEGNKSLSNLLLYIVNPMMIINSFATEYTDELMHGLLWALALSFATYFLSILIAHFIIPASVRSFEIDRFACVYSNCGFMGIPLVMALFGSTGVLYLSAYIAVFSLFVWTHGYMLMTGSRSLGSFVKGLRSPAVIAVIIGFIIFIGRIHMPAVVSDTIGYLACMNTALSMLIAGISLAESDLLVALKNRRIYIVSAIKLLLIPVVVALVFHFIPVNQMVLITLLVANACPSATTATLFALRFNKDHLYASQIFAITTVFSMVTIPLVILLGEALL